MKTPLNIISSLCCFVFIKLASVWHTARKSIWNLPSAQIDKYNWVSHCGFPIHTNLFVRAKEVIIRTLISTLKSKLKAECTGTPELESCYSGDIYFSNCSLNVVDVIFFLKCKFAWACPEPSPPPGFRALPVCLASRCRITGADVCVTNGVRYLFYFISFTSQSNPSRGGAGVYWNVPSAL